MLLESHVKLCVTKPDFLGKIILPPKLGKWKYVLQQKFILFAVFLHKSCIWENSDSCAMGQNVLSQSDHSIF